MINICHWYRHHEGFLVLDMDLAIIPSCSEKCNVINGYAYELSLPWRMNTCSGQILPLDVFLLVDSLLMTIWYC